MSSEAEAVVRAGAPTDALTHRRVAFMRYHGQGHEIEVALPNRDLRPEDLVKMQSAFEGEYSRQFSRTVPGMRIEILNWGLSVSSPSPELSQGSAQPETRQIHPQLFTDVTCDITGQTISAALIERRDLVAGDLITGPALIIEPQTTTLVSADFRVEVDTLGNIWMTRQQEEPS